jgi:hypothetical protein
VLAERRGDLLVLSIPGTQYRLHLVPEVPPQEISTVPGKRIRGVIRATALRLHPAAAGGRFIEPVWGEPRIVQGVILAVEPDRVLVDASVPMWVALAEEDRGRAPLEPGQMVNFYVTSGTSFRPGE